EVNWVHEDPITKSKRLTDISGNVISAIELDPWGADTNRSSNQAFQPHKYTTYERDGNGSDEAMFRRYNRWHSRFDHLDPYDGNYDFTDPQSFNRYSYTQNDPVNFVDPSGLESALVCLVDGMPWNCGAAFKLVEMGAATVKNGPGFYGDYLVVGHGFTSDCGSWSWQVVYSLADPQDTGITVDYYTKFLAKFVKCIRVVFGKDAQRAMNVASFGMPSLDTT